MTPSLAAQRGQRDPVMRIWTGVYADAQAERGKTTFVAVCASCHSPDLAGGSGPQLAGPKFMAKWELESLNQMFRIIKDNMPRNRQGTLDDPTVIDLMAYILKSNTFPAAAAPTASLSADEEVLESVVFVPKTGPTKIPNFALVRSVGCLTRRADNSWTLTQATEPLSTKDAPATDAELTDAKASEPGSETFRLVSAGSYKPEAHTGEKVHVKGIINRTKPDVLLNVTSFQSLGSACQK